MNPPSPPQPGCDIAIRNGKIITCDGADSIASAIAIHDGRIMAVGSDDEIAGLATDRTRVIDAGGRAVIPGLIDGHAHMDREGLKGVFPSLSGCRSVADVLGRIEALVREVQPGDWVVTMPIGEPPYYFDVPDNLAEKRFPTRAELDRIAPDNPVYIRPIWGYWRHELPLHSVANSRALDAGGLYPDHPDLPPSVTLETDPDTGEATGLILEDSFVPIVELAFFAMMPRFVHDDRVAGLKAAMAAYNRTGTTSVFEEHGCSQEVIQAYQALRREDTQTVRASLIYSPSWHFLKPDDYPRVLESWAGWLGGQGLGDDWLRVEGLYTEPGISLENALRARASPYSGWAGFNYDCGIPEDALVDFLIAAARADIRISTITIDFLDLFKKNRSLMNPNPSN
ncbi:MAG: amidohydrolase family protein [Alphaproteobacteria bacterium]